MASTSIPRAVANAAYRAVLGSTWIAARDLPPAHRRLARLGLFAAGIGVEYAKSPSSFREMFKQEDQPQPEPAELPPFDKRKATITALSLGLVLTTTLGRRRLEKRWIRQLRSSGHPHPATALALRMAPVEFAGQLLLHVADVYTPTSDDR